MSEKHYVCQGAICECDFGTAPDKLKVVTQSKRFINEAEGINKLVATHKDIGMTFENNTFGQCKLQPTPGGFKPCIPALLKWNDYYEKVRLKDNDGNPLLEDSTGVCSIGGISIKITYHGQTAELTQQNLKNANDELMAELFPFVNVKEADKIRLYISNQKPENS